MAHRLLIVDRDPETRQGLAALLSDAGYDVIACGDVPSALEVRADIEPDLLITDVRLGDYNGLQLLAMVARSVPAIAITAFPDAGVEAHARRLGAEYLVRPVPFDALRNLIARMLTARESHRDLGRTGRAPRTVLMRRISVRVGQYLGHVVQVSATGLRLEVHGSRETEPPDALALQLGLGATVPITIAWKRHTARTWICGAAIAQEGEAAWRAFLATL